MENIQTILLGIVIILNVVLLSKISGVAQMLRTPVVKKLQKHSGPKGQRVSVQEINQNKDNRKNNRGSNAPDSSDGKNRRNRRERPDRNRNNRGRDRRGTEVLGNEASSQPASQVKAEMKSNVQENSAFEKEPKVAPKQETASNESAPVVEKEVQTQRSERPAGRRPLRPRVTEPVAPSSSDTDYQSNRSAPEQSSNDSSVEFNPARMRHGRRTMIKKAPVFEDDSTK